MNNKMAQFAKSQAPVSMSTHPTLLVEIAFKLGIEKPGDDKEKLVIKVNKKLAEYKKAG
ncbi:hypothetical protein D3C71_1347390 [compost metagenome]